MPGLQFHDPLTLPILKRMLHQIVERPDRGFLYLKGNKTTVKMIDEIKPERQVSTARKAGVSQ
jgi:hypothetical protein